MKITSFAKPNGYWVADVDIEVGDGFRTPTLAVAAWAMTDATEDGGDITLDPVILFEGSLRPWYEFAVGYRLLPVDRSNWVNAVRNSSSDE